MNDDQLNKLFAAARAEKHETWRTEIAFETRLLARLREAREAREAIPWFVWGWRLAPLFAAIVIALGVWNYTAPGDPLVNLSDDYRNEAMLVGLLTEE